tara:strand:+ start:176 stop:595 length:420 start_codon:yes stop_codon:yes gene_type:complete
LKYQEIQNILKNSKIILIIGLSRDNNKDSNIIAQYLLKNNYQIIGINPNSNRISNIKCYKELKMMSKNQLKNIDIINIFRPSNELINIIKQIIQLKELRKSVIWSQMGILDKRAEESAIKNNMKIIMNKCIKIEHSNIN